jgi:hypothetical protein
MTDCTDLYNARIRAAMEGDYTIYTLQSGYSPISVSNVDYEQITNDYAYYTASNNSIHIIDLGTGVDTNLGTYWADVYGSSVSANGKYVVATNTDVIQVFKDGVALAPISLSGVTNGTNCYISPNGEWILVYFSNKIYIYKGA